MANFASLKATIDAQIKANGNQEITGPILNAVLTAMINTIGNGYALQGTVAQTSDNPGSPDNPVAYLAAGPGTYTNFGGTVIPDDGHAYLLTWDTAWTAVQLPLATYTLVDGKVDKVAGYGLSKNDYTDADKAKLAGLPDGATLANDLNDKQDKDPAANAGEAAVFDGSGNTVGSGTPFSDLALKDIGANAGDVAVMDANGNAVDGGTPLADLALQTAVDNKADKVGGASNGDLPELDADGNLSLSGLAVSDLATKQDLAGVAAGLGIAEAVIDTDNAGTQQEFTFRQSGGDGGAFYRRLLGRTINTPGVLKSNDYDAIKTHGFNWWDEQWELGGYNTTTGAKDSTTNKIRSKGKIRAIPSTDYWSKEGLTLFFYDANGAYISYETHSSPHIYTTPANCAYFSFNATTYYGVTYKHDICINISDASKNGIYEPYWERTRHLGLTTKEDSNGNVPFPNGLQACPTAQDEADKQGGVVRVGTRSYQAGDESDATVITDGTNTNYALTTPQPFTWAEPLNLAVKVDEGGTEEAVQPAGATEPSAPFTAMTTYTMSIARMVAILQGI